MSVLFIPPWNRPLGDTAAVLPEGKQYFYLTETLTEASVYDADGNVLSQPVEADATGKFPSVYLDPAITYRARLLTSADVEVFDVDPYSVSGDGSGPIGTLEDLQAGAIIPADTELLNVSGISAVGDTGTGMPLGYDAAVDSAFAAANPLTSFYDSASGRGYRFMQEPWTGTLGRASPAGETDWAPIRINGLKNDYFYSNDPVSVAYDTETSDGQFSVDAVWCAPYGDNLSGDGTQEAPYRDPEYALRYTTVTNIHLLPAIDGSEGVYEDFFYRYDVTPTDPTKLRVLIGHGPITFKKSCDDISIDAVAKGTVGIPYGGSVTAGNTVDIDGNTLTYTATPSGPLDILLDPGDGRAEWAQRLAAAINLNTTLLGVTGVYVPPTIITDPANVLITANDPGSGGNAITLATTGASLVASDTTLTGGGDGWTDEGDGVWSYQTTEGYSLPRAVINHAVKEPNKGQSQPLAYYANVRRLTFSGQPSPGDYFENSSGYQGATRRLTFVASGGGTYNETTKQGSVDIGSTLAETITNLVSLINNNSLYFGLLVDGTATVARLAVRMNSNPTITATVSGANLSLAAQSPGYTELSTFALVTSGNIPFAAFSVGGWAFDEATLKLYVKLPGNIDIQANKANLELIVGTAADRCFIYGGKLGFLGNFQWRGLYLAAFYSPNATYPTRIWATFTNPPDRPVAFVTPMDTGVFELAGVQAVMQGGWGIYTSIDTYHITTFTAAPKVQALDAGSEYAGDPFTFPVIEFPNRNGISPHGSGASTVVMGGPGFNRSVGPNVGGEGVMWNVGIQGNYSWGLTNQFGLYANSGTTYYTDSSNFVGNADADVRNDVGINYEFNVGKDTETGTSKAYIPPAE